MKTWGFCPLSGIRNLSIISWLSPCSLNSLSFTDSTSGFSQQSPSFQRQLPSVLLEIPFWNGSIRRTPASVLSTISWFTPWKTAFYTRFFRQFTAAAVWSLKITAREVETLPSSRASLCRFSPAQKQGAGTPASMQ